MIQDVEKLRPELESNPLCKVRVLRGRQIQSRRSRSGQRIARELPYVPFAGGKNASGLNHFPGVRG